MRDSFEVNAHSGKYSIISDIGLLDDVIAHNPEAVYIIDSFFLNRLSKRFSHCIAIEANENNKSLDYIPNVIIKLRELGCNRSTRLIAIGGGVIQDIVTLVASIYMRGITWSYMPTTLLGMVDSCIGGKSSINVSGFKNLVGNFYPPKEVFIDLHFIDSLNQEQIVGGLYEAVKICYARSILEFENYLACASTFSCSLSNSQKVVMRTLLAKRWFIEIDEFDQNERLLLNFGHTFGHALEAATEFSVSHGIAVGIGMLIAINYSIMQNSLNEVGRVHTSSLQNYILSLLCNTDNPVITMTKPVDLEFVLEKFSNDKKHQAEYYRIILPINSGELSVISEPKNKTTQLAILDAYKKVFQQIGWSVLS